MGEEVNNTAVQEAGATPDVSTTADHGSVDWADLADSPVEFAADDGAFVMEPELPPEAAAPSQTPSVKPEVQQPSPVTTPVTEAPPVTQPAPVDPTQQAQQTPPAPQSQVDVDAYRARYHESLQTDYAISPDDAAALAISPETVMPKLAANLHMRVMQDVAKHVDLAMRTIPQMLEQRLQQTQAEDSAKQVFYNEWPGLSSQYDLVVKHAQMARASNPQATREQIINMAGLLTAMALGVDPATVRKGAGAPQGQAPQGQSPQAQRPQTVPPFKPAAVGSGPAAYETTSQNLYEAFAEEDSRYWKG